MPTLRVLLVLVALSIGTPALAQSYPNRPIKVLHGLLGGRPPMPCCARWRPPRKLARHPVVVENRPGASGTIAAATVVSRPA
jgi:tripartite-type tricarboxylate transporter receptor subunit TctC